MDQVTLWMVRHGQTLWNADHKISGWHDVELSEAGRAMARALGQRLQHQLFTAVWSSDLKRAQETARLAQAQEPVPDQRLRELDFGPLEGRDWRQLEPALQQAVHDFAEGCTCGGETISQFEQRVLGFLDELSPGRHLLFVHAGVIRVALRRVQADQYLGPASLVILDWSGAQLLELHPGPVCEG